MANIKIFIPISRKNRVREIEEMVDQFDSCGNNIRVLVIADNIDIKGFECKYTTKFINTGNFGASEIDIYKRRERITRSFVLATDYIEESDDFVFVFEDDCVVNTNALKSLLKIYRNKEKSCKVGFVSGVQVGRWGFRMLGVWEQDGDTMKTLPYTPNKIVEVDACGFYCFIVGAEFFKTANFKYDFFGPDVNFGKELVRNGFKNFCDMGLEVGHITNSGKILLPSNSDIVELSYLKEKNKWRLSNMLQKEVQK